MDDSVSFPLPIIVSSAPDDSATVGSANTTDTDGLWDQFNKFYNKNEKAIEKCMKTDVRSIALGEAASDIELQIDTFSETTKVVLDGLAGLGKIHPIIGAAVVAFHAVISLDMSRRDNDRKVIAIMLEMQNMMCAMFQLRHLKHTHVQESERDTEKSRLHKLIESITADIIQCGSDLNYYLGQKFAFRLIKSKNFEQRFKTHVENFARRRAELQSTITVYIAGGVDQANITISEVSKKLDDMDSKLGYFFHAFLRQLDTPQEKEAFRFFEQNNGVENCISKDDLLGRLLTMTGDVLPDSENKDALKTEERIKKSRKILTDEVHQDFEEALKQNTFRFDRLLTIQNNNHERVIAQLEKQEGYHKVTVSKLDKLLYYMHPDTKLSDPEVRRIWERMGLKTSVKAKNFVLTFRDHYQHDHSAPPTPNPMSTLSPPTVTNGAQPLSLSTNFDDLGPASPSEDPNAWLLEYIDVAHVRPIVEAMDADGSGFISVKEINTFARARPKEWSLLQWMVYWAAGWHINITQYRDKIYDVLNQMHELLPALHPANRVYVDEYLDSYSVDTIEAILRSTKSITDGQQTQITDLAQFYANAQESALQSNLKEVSYVISSAADATLVAGPARAESWIYPLLYLLLERHLAVFKLGRTHVFSASEIYTHWVSLESVLGVFKQRQESLTAIFSQIYQNVAGRFETFAYGIFYASYQAETEITPAKNTLAKMRTKRSTRELLLEMRYKGLEVAPDTSILAHEKATSFEFQDLNILEGSSPKTNADHDPHPLDGYWSMSFRDGDGDFPTLGLCHFVLSVAPSGSIVGSGECYTGVIDVTGTLISSGKETPISVELEMAVRNLDKDNYTLHGIYSETRGIVTGSWERTAYIEESHPEANAVDIDAVGTQEEVPSEIVENTEPACESTGPNDGDGDPIDSSQPAEEDNGTGDVDAQQTSIADVVPTDEIVATSGPTPDEQEDIKPQADPTIEEQHTSPEKLTDNDQQLTSNDSTTHDDTGATGDDVQSQETTLAGKNLEEHSNSDLAEPLVERAQDQQNSDDVAVKAGNATSEDHLDPPTAEVVTDSSIAGGVIEDAEGVDDADAEEVEEEEEETPPSLNTFHMRRTPEHVYRFRRDFKLDSEADSSLLVKNRWKFAIEATKFQLQIKNMSWEYVRARFAERRLWLDLAVAFWKELLRPDRNDFMCALTMAYPPSQSRLYERIADFLNDRGLPYRTGRTINCDYCGRNIVCVRYRCITCIKEDMSNQIDLCSDAAECINNPSSNTRHDFVHTPSHTLLRQNYFLHKLHLSYFIPQCRTRSENIKKRYRTLEENKKIAKKIAKASKSGKSGHTSHTEESSNVQPLFCVCCEKEVSLPCWVCATCVTDTAVCLECELKRAKVVKYDDRDTMHSHDHLVLRISDSTEVQSREVNNIRLQRELINITTDLRSLEQKVTTHLRAASKVNTVLRRFTVDGDVKVVTTSSTSGPENGAPAADGSEVVAPSPEQAVNEDDDDDDMTSIFGSIDSSDTESEAMKSAPSTPTPAEPQPLPAESDANGTETVTVPLEAEAPQESDPDVTIIAIPSLVEDALPMDAPTPTGTQFFEATAGEPDTSMSQNDTVSPPLNTANGHALEVESEAAPAERPTRAPKARQLKDHLVSIDARITALDTQMTSRDTQISTQISDVNTRISSLDSRLSGVESQLGEILSLLRQIRS